MNLEALLDGPVVDPLPGEHAMLRSLIHGLVWVQEQIAALQAREAMLLTCALEVVELQTDRLPDGTARDREMPLRAASAEIGAALRLSDRAVQRRLSDAATRFRRFPCTHTALAQGRISRAHAAVIVEAGVSIDDDETRAAFELAAVDRAEVETAGRLRTVVRTIAEHVQPTSITERHRIARGARGVRVDDLDDGMAQLVATLPAVLAHGMHDRLTQMGRAVREAAAGAKADAAGGADHDGRTLDNVRADIIADMILAGAPAAAGDGLDAIRAHVQITVPVLVAAGQGDSGAELAGSGPIDAETARILAGGARGWDRVMTHPVTGAVLTVDRYRPSEELRRTLRVRDEHCRFPGCRLPVRRCDIDHSHDAALGGETSADNLAHLCRGHHTLKHAVGWTVEHLGGGTLQWTSPTGSVYVDIPPAALRSVRFVPDGDPPPF